MKATVDSMGRVLIPKALRTSLGITPGQSVDISAYANGLHIVPGGRTARVGRDEHGHLVATSDTVVTDETVFALIDADRK